MAQSGDTLSFNSTCENGGRVRLDNLKLTPASQSVYGTDCMATGHGLEFGGGFDYACSNWNHVSVISVTSYNITVGNPPPSVNFRLGNVGLSSTQIYTPTVKHAVYLISMDVLVSQIDPAAQCKVYADLSAPASDTDVWTPSGTSGWLSTAIEVHDLTPSTQWVTLSGIAVAAENVSDIRAGFRCGVLTRDLTPPTSIENWVYVDNIAITPISSL